MKSSVAISYSFAIKVSMDLNFKGSFEMKVSHSLHSIIHGLKTTSDSLLINGVCFPSLPLTVVQSCVVVIVLFTDFASHPKLLGRAADLTDKLSAFTYRSSG